MARLSTKLREGMKLMVEFVKNRQFEKLDTLQQAEALARELSTADMVILIGRAAGL